jgi:hypothetical protein
LKWRFAPHQQKDDRPFPGFDHRGLVRIDVNMFKLAANAASAALDCGRNPAIDLR